MTGDNLLTNKAWSKVKEDERSSKAMKVVEALENVARRTASTLSSDLTVHTPSIGRPSQSTVVWQELAEPLS